MFEKSSPPFKHWLRHMVGVPRGFLRYLVFNLLKEKPRSGSEIIEEIEGRTDGRWKPSPGSVYPLLAWLQENGYTEEVSSEEAGIKRYALTEKGQEFHKEQLKFKKRLQKKMESILPTLFNGFWISLHPDLQEPAKKFARAIFDLKIAIEENPSDLVLEETSKFLEQTSKRIEEIKKKFLESESN